MSRTLSKVLRSLTVPFVGRGRSPRRLQALRWSGSELLEQRQLLTAATAAADMELQVYHSTGVNSVSIALPPDAVSFQAITFSPLLGTVALNSSGPLSVNYEYSSSGVDSFGISYLDAYGSTRTQNVNIIIVDDYTGTDLLDSPDPQGEQDFLGGLYNGFVNSSSGTGGVPNGGSAYYGGNGAGSVLGSGSGGTGGSGGGTSPAPEIAVYGKNLLIVDGDSTPSATDDTDYGIVSSGQFVDHTFTVTNSGTANLSLQLHQLPAGWMITESLSLYLAPGASDSFTVRFAPTSSGQYSTDIIIDNNDADENPYNFVIRGATNAPEIGVSGNGIVIVDGDSTPAIPDGTQFGWINAGQSVTRTFTVNNSGSAVLTLQTPQLPFGFSLAEPLASQLAPGANDTFTVSFSPQGAGTYSGEISIGNNDSDENPYNFAILGSVSAPEIGVSGGVGIDDGDWTPSTADGTDFGMISSGQSVTRTFTVQNSGSATLTLQSPQLPAGFVLTESLATQLAPGTSDTFSVQFSPVNPGTYSGEISIGNNDSNENPYNFAITGTMGGPEINVLGNGYVIVDGDTVPSAVDGTYFGTVGPGQTVDHTFIVNNTGTALLSLSLRALPAGFLLTEPLTSVLAAGGTDSFTVRFAPDVVGQYGGEIIIDNNDADEASYNFAVFGIRGTPEMDVRGNGVSIADGDNTPSAADDTYFGMTPPNIVASRTFTVRNDGTTTLYLGQVSLGPGSGFRIGSDTLLSQIGPGQSDTFSVELVSATPGTFVRTVTIYNSDSDECPYDFVIRGIVGVPEIDLTGKGVSITDGDTTPSTTDDTDFGSVLVSTATTTHTLTKTFTVTNTGSGTLYLGTPSVTGPGFWRGAKALRTWLEPGESDTFDVKFASTTTGTFTGEVILYNSDANEAPYNFAVTAAVTAPEIAVLGKDFVEIASGATTSNPANGSDFGYVTRGEVRTQTFRITNTGNAILSLSGMIFSSPNFSLQTLLPNSVPAGAFVDVGVGSLSSVVGTFSSLVTLVNSDPDESPYTFTVLAIAADPDIEVSGNGILIASGDNTPELLDDTDFGSILFSARGVTNTFKVTNNGSGTLRPIIKSLPAGFALGTNSLSSSIPPGDFDTFEIVMESSATPKSLRGGIEIQSNDPDESSYVFEVKGEIRSFQIAGIITYDVLSPKPVRGALVVAYEDDLGNTELGRSYTTDSGEYLILTTQSANSLFLRVFAQSAAASDAPGQSRRQVIVESDGFNPITIGQDYYHEFVPSNSILNATTPSVIANESFSSKNETDNSSRAFWIYDAALNASRVHASLPGIAKGSYDILYPNPYSNISYAFGANVNIAMNDWKNWDVIIHEYGHLVAGDAGFFNMTGSPAGWYHSLTENNRVYNGAAQDWDDCMQLGFNEGWSNFFSLKVQRLLGVAEVNLAADTGGYKAGDGTFREFDPESATPLTSIHPVAEFGEDQEIAVMRILWDLCDPKNDDGIAIELGELYRLLKQHKPDTIGKLWDVLFNTEFTSFADRLSLGEIFEAQGVSPLMRGLIVGAAPPSKHLQISAASIPPTIQWSIPLASDKQQQLLNQFRVKIFSDQGSLCFDSGILTIGTSDGSYQVGGTTDESNYLTATYTPLLSDWQSNLIIGVAPRRFKVVVTGEFLESTMGYGSIQTGAYWSGAADLEITP